MAERHDDAQAEKGQHTTRRTFVKTVGVAATAALGSSTFGGATAAETTVDLGEEGLSNGDNIDSYLEEHFTDGNRVLIPAGEYEYTGAGLGGDKGNCALVGSPDGVTFNRPDDPETTVRPGIRATSGTVRVENITVKGKRGQEQSRWRVGAAEGATMEVVNVNMPDGTVDGSDSTGLYAGTDHAGTLRIQSCYLEGFGNVALYVSDPYTGGNGKVVVEDCVLRNTNAAGVRFAPGDSVIRGCYFEATETAPAEEGGGVAQRGIKFDDAGQDVVVEDCDFVWGDPGGPCFDFHERGQGGSGVVRNCRIRNDSDSAPIDTEWDVQGNWSGENISLTGSGDTELPEGFEAVTGSEATAPNTDYAIWTPVGDSSAGTTESGSTDVTSADSSNASTETNTTEESTESTETESENTETETETTETEETETETTETETATESASNETAAETDEPEADDDSSDDSSSTEPSTPTPESSNASALSASDSSANESSVGDVVTEDSSSSGESEDGSTTITGQLVDSSADDSASASSAPERDSDESSESPSGDAESESEASQPLPKRIEIDGTGDAEEGAMYGFAVSGDLVVDEERTVVKGGTTLEAKKRATDGSSSSGRVCNGVAAYYYSGEVRSIDVHGKADVNRFQD
ncbi:hypothetical protein KTS45_02640 [Halomicroarcula limicola]|uniref:Right handed beta helix domain-containing protein n=1 Tax=Haloarcula limicola TaxID=1429915 RepID=A0A8J7Y6N8_9EURY|nr:hypothetical protein [Halomicroarcula limicola]MBV0923086.1 hypothetical protein [Halomicroarcula limicola]